jgi:PPK2 family polyphosphate:nucleotide phosphotransferase
METIEPVASPNLVPFDGTFRVAGAPTGPPGGVPEKKELKDRLKETVKELHDLQRKLWAHDRYALLLVFQAMDAGGKDSTIRHVFSGVDPAGFRVSSFKAPTHEELDHDFLWRTTLRLPGRGQIGIFNRSHYEEVLVVRVHPEYLDGQRLPGLSGSNDRERLWEHRFESIRQHELHLARNGTVIVKLFLNVSKEEQRQRFLSRLDEPEKNWKFNAGDVKERGRWDDYMRAYEKALAATSRPWAPWYAVPADSKPYMRLTVARLVAERLRSLGLEYPEPDAEERARFDEMRRLLEADREL